MQYYELYTNKFNIDEMDRFLERHKLPKLTKNKIDNLSKSVSMKK